MEYGIWTMEIDKFVQVEYGMRNIEHGIWTKIKNMEPGLVLDLGGTRTVRWERGPGAKPDPAWSQTWEKGSRVVGWRVQTHFN